MTSTEPLHVVGIGASAGGLQALESFFEHVQPDCGMAFVVVQHLSPDFKSVMDELLSRRTEMRVVHAEDGMLVEPNRVYLNPPKKDMILSGGRLVLSDREREHDLSLPIDVFFRSLAQDIGGRAVAIVLSGGGSDGSRGIRDVRDAGGLVLVQDESSAQFNGMPKTAIDAGVAHWVLPPEEMPRILAEYMRAFPAVPSSPPPRTAPRGLEGIYRMLEDDFGIDFTHYKPSTITRRIERRLQLSRSSDLAEYAARLRASRGELDALYRDLLIGVTHFFRNEEAFATLEKLLAEQLAAGPNDVPFRVWIAGCGTGEEAYSIGILLQELTAKTRRPVKIFATDVHRGSIEIASRGIYDEDALAGVPRERLQRYFVRIGPAYQVVPELRQTIVFAAHNLMKDPPFTRVDLVTCRNLLIYLQPATQLKALTHFHFALARGGLLFLGPSESPALLARAFEPVDPHWRIYRKFSDARVGVEARFLRPRASETRPLPDPQAGFARHPLSQLLGTYDGLLEMFMPPSLLVSESGELVHSFGGANRFLRARDGRLGLHLVDMVGEELRMVLVGGMQRVKKDHAPVVCAGVRASWDETENLYRVTLRPVPARNGAARHVLISFEPTDWTPAPRIPEEEIDVGRISLDQISALQLELSHTRESLEAAIEELQTSNEELQASNEELLASNEELQSTNEELQSVNEELYTVNAEYQRKIAELTELTNDVDNLLASTEVGTIFLDPDLRIRKFTPQLAESFNLVPHDIGRRIETFAHNLNYTDLIADIRPVLEGGPKVERETKDRQGRTFFLRILPYRVKGAIDGVVLTLVDINGLKAAEDALFRERYLLDSLLAGLPDAIYFKDVSGRIIRANQAMAERLGCRDASDLVGRVLLQFAGRAEAERLHREDAAVLESGQAQHYQLEKRENPGGEPAWDVATRLPLKDPADHVVGVIAIFRDVSEQRRAEENIRDAVKRRDQFLAMLSHELRNPLNAIVASSDLLQRGGEDRAGVLRILDRQSRQMARLLDDLLEASRVTQNKIELRKERLDLRMVTKDAVEAAKKTIEGRRLRLTVQMIDEPLYVDGDAARLQQIQANLLGNAAKYTPQGGNVWLELAREGHHAVLRVRDDGVGIPKETLGTIFELFVQSRRTIDRSEGGLGVGLCLVRSLVTLHHGTVTAASDGEGKGSEFVVRIPLAPNATAPARNSGPTARTVGLERGAKVLVVEDNADSRELLCAMLEGAGFECVSAADGSEALELLAKFTPDVAILDLGLPVIDGFELARRIRADPKHELVVLIALSGYGQPDDRAASRAAGFDQHLVKPIAPSEVLRVLTHSQPDGELRRPTN